MGLRTHVLSLFRNSGLSVIVFDDELL